MDNCNIHNTHNNELSSFDEEWFDDAPPAKYSRIDDNVDEMMNFWKKEEGLLTL